MALLKRNQLYSASGTETTGIPDPAYYSRSEWEIPSGPPDLERLGEIRRASHPQFFVLFHFIFLLISILSFRDCWNTSKAEPLHGSFPFSLG